MTQSQIRIANLDDCKAIAFVHVESWRSTYPGIVPDEYLNNLRYEDREALWTRILGQTSGNTHTLVAVDKGSSKVIGFASGGPAREESLPCKGEIYAIYLLKSYHGFGIGRQLFETMRNHLEGQDLLPFMLWVLEKNPTCGFYENLHGKVIGRKTETVGGVSLVELAYSWDS